MPRGGLGFGVEADTKFHCPEFGAWSVAEMRFDGGGILGQVYKATEYSSLLQIERFVTFGLRCPRALVNQLLLY